MPRAGAHGARVQREQDFLGTRGGVPTLPQAPWPPRSCPPPRRGPGRPRKALCQGLGTQWGGHLPGAAVLGGATMPRWCGSTSASRLTARAGRPASLGSRHRGGPCSHGSGPTPARTPCSEWACVLGALLAPWAREPRRARCRALAGPVLGLPSVTLPSSPSTGFKTRGAGRGPNCCLSNSDPRAGQAGSGRGLRPATPHQAATQDGAEHQERPGPRLPPASAPSCALPPPSAPSGHCIRFHSCVVRGPSGPPAGQPSRSRGPGWVHAAAGRQRAAGRACRKSGSWAARQGGWAWARRGRVCVWAPQRSAPGGRHPALRLPADPARPGPGEAARLRVARIWE